MFRFILLPVALVSAIFGAMAAHTIATSIYRQMSWTPVTVDIVEAEEACALTYQPLDSVLRKTAAIGACDTVASTPLPDGGSAPRLLKGEYGRLTYEVSGAAMEWRGKLSDAGVYNAKAGEQRALVYDPLDPTQLDTPDMGGWMGGLLILLVGWGFPAFYVWHFWLKRR